MRRHIEGTNDLEPIVKWPGGKEKELQHIVDNAPMHFETFYEPFVGGGSVFMAIQADHYMINDFSTELINLYHYIQNQDADFYRYVQGMNTTWNNVENFFNQHCDYLSELYVNYRTDIINYAELVQQIDAFVNRHEEELTLLLSVIQQSSEIFISEIKRNSKDKMKRMKKIETDKGELCNDDLHDNIETSLKASVYMYYRTLYNRNNAERPIVLQTALFFFLRNFAYSGMFRFSKKGDFNVPYGGIAYNSKHLSHKLNYYQNENVIAHFANTGIFNLDFEQFLTNNPPTPNDFVFLDPPYDSEFSTYDQNEFGRRDQERLANYLINACQGQWLMIIKYTEFIYNLYANHPGINILNFDKEYIVSFMNRNDKNVTHLIIKNY